MLSGYCIVQQSSNLETAVVGSYRMALATFDLSEGIVGGRSSDVRRNTRHSASISSLVCVGMP